MNDSAPAYGLWSLLLLNSAIFNMFAFSFMLILFGSCRSGPPCSGC
jgi:hypothetical protein